jgi:hypothetical protein
VWWRADERELIDFKEEDEGGRKLEGGFIVSTSARAVVARVIEGTLRNNPLEEEP